MANEGAAPAGAQPHDNTLYSASSAPRVYALTVTLFVPAFLTYALRMYTRARIGYGWDDWAMTVAMVLIITDWGLTIGSQAASGGKYMMFLSPEDLMQAMKLSFISMPFWVWVMAFLKTSVCLMLLRIKKSRPWTAGISILIFVQFASAIAATICQLLQCAPIAANWNPTLPGAECWSAARIKLAVYSCTSIFIFTDFACAALPLAFIAKVRRPLREKIVLTLLMALGIAAGICGIVKLVLLSTLDGTSDPIWQDGKFALLAYSEALIGITSANIPCLKALLEKAYRRLGGHISSFSVSNKTGGVSGGATTGKDGSMGPNSYISTQSGPKFEVSKGRDSPNESYGFESDKYIIKQTAVSWQSNV